jgi:cell division protein FtsB
MRAWSEKLNPRNRVAERETRHVIQEKIGFGEQFRAFLATNATLLLAAGVGLLLISDVFGTHGVLAMRRSEQQASDIQKQINQLNQENEELQSRVKALKTDPSAVEHIAREEMGLARPGEYIFKVPPRGNGDSNSSAAPADASPKP